MDHHCVSDLTKGLFRKCVRITRDHIRSCVLDQSSLNETNRKTSISSFFMKHSAENPFQLVYELVYNCYSVILRIFKKFRVM